MDSRIIEDLAVELARRAVTGIPEDVLAALKRAAISERDGAARIELSMMVRNMEEARRCMLPMCQDTGLPIFFIRAGNFPIEGFEEAARRSIARATDEVPLRKNVVSPLSRKNSGDNTGHLIPYFSYEMTGKDYWEISYLPKGAGSENMSALAMLTPSAGQAGIRRFVVDTLVKAGGKPCPPVIVGVGIGGSSDICMSLAKKAIMRPIGSSSPEPDMALLERDLLKLANETGIGPMGLGGDTTALAVNVEWASCHTASLPVGVNLQCYAARRATARVFRDGKVEYGRD